MSASDTATLLSLRVEPVEARRLCEVDGNDGDELSLGPTPGVNQAATCRRNRRRELEARVVPEDRALELLERATRLDPELIHEHLSRVLVHAQRVGLATRAVEGEHELSASALPEWLLGHERLELADEIRVSTQREASLDRFLAGDEVQLLEPGDLGLRERRVGEVGECRPAPESERAASASAASAASPPARIRRPSASSRSKRCASSRSRSISSAYPGGRDTSGAASPAAARLLRALDT